MSKIQMRGSVFIASLLLVCMVKAQWGFGSSASVKEDVEEELEVKPVESLSEESKEPVVEVPEVLQQENVEHTEEDVDVGVLPEQEEVQVESENSESTAEHPKTHPQEEQKDGEPPPNMPQRSKWEDVHKPIHDEIRKMQEENERHMRKVQEDVRQMHEDMNRMRQEVYNR